MLNDKIKNKLKKQKKLGQLVLTSEPHSHRHIIEITS